MAVIEFKITIDRPIDEVFGFVSDFNNAPTWQPDVQEVRQSEGKTRVGTMVTERRRLRVLFYQLDMNADVTDYRLNRKLEYKGVIGAFPFVASYSFDPAGRSTNVTETLDVRVFALHRIFGGFIVGTLRRRTENTWRNLKAHLEKRNVH